MRGLAVLPLLVTVAMALVLCASIVTARPRSLSGRNRLPAALAESSTSIELETDSELQSESESESEFESEAGTELDADAAGTAELDAGAEAEADAESQTESQTEAEADADASVETYTAAEAKTIAEMTIRTAEDGGGDYPNCDTCINVLERIKAGSGNGFGMNFGRAYHLPTICNVMWKTDPETYGPCHQALHAIRTNGRNVFYWIRHGCFENYLYQHRHFIHPCPSHVICAVLRDFKLKPFCGSNDKVSQYGLKEDDINKTPANIGT